MLAPVGSGRQSACGFYTSFKLVSLAQESQFGRILRELYRSMASRLQNGESLMSQ